MLAPLDEKYAEILSEQLNSLSANDRRFFDPHPRDIDSVRRLCHEQGNHYYLYFDKSNRFAGYGMLRTFGDYEIPTLGCIVWHSYRKLNHGKVIVGELLNEAIKLRYNRVRLKVHPENKVAYNLYEELGFERIEKENDGQIWMEFRFAGKDVAKHASDG